MASAEREVPGQTMEKTPPHTHNVHMMEKVYGGDGHDHHHKMYGQHAAGHMKEHEKVMALCGGGKTMKMK